MSCLKCTCVSFPDEFRVFYSLGFTLWNRWVKPSTHTLYEVGAPIFNSDSVRCRDASNLEIRPLWSRYVKPTTPVPTPLLLCCLALTPNKCFPTVSLLFVTWLIPRFVCWLTHSSFFFSINWLIPRFYLILPDSFLYFFKKLPFFFYIL